MELLFQFLTNTGCYLADYRHVVMILAGSTFVYLAIAKEYEPLRIRPGEPVNIITHR
jgi:oxaloacetate decarboxylase beta subunit